MTDLPLQAPVKHVLVNLAGSPDARCGGRRGSPAQAGLQCREAARARSVLERVLRTCSAGGAASLRPAVLRTVLHPLVPKVQRLLLGLCRRHGCQMMALEPLGGPKATEAKQVRPSRENIPLASCV
eukprot:1183724-Prorocentrum_minimum.AAC.1